MKPIYLILLALLFPLGLWLATRFLIELLEHSNESPESKYGSTKAKPTNATEPVIWKTNLN
jgi:hypothetical protein